jgi:hypothetical protein
MGVNPVPPIPPIEEIGCVFILINKFITLAIRFGPTHGREKSFAALRDFAKTKIKVLNELRVEYWWGTTGTPTQVSSADFHTLAQQPRRRPAHRFRWRHRRAGVRHPRVSTPVR